MKISRVLHAGYVFESKDAQIIFDPIFENPFSINGFAYPDVEFDYAQISKLKVAAVFISHYHDDHFSLKSLSYLDRETPIYFYCIHEELFNLIKELGFKKVFQLRTDEPVKTGPFEVIPKLALDTDVDSIFHIKAEGLNVLNVVDSWIDPAVMSALKEIRWDTILWPFQTMREIEVVAPELSSPAEFPHEWLDQLKQLKPHYIVPSSCQFIQEEWSWYRKAYFPISYKRFENEIGRILPNSTVCRLNPGVSIELSFDSNDENIRESQPLPWIIPKGEQNVDYEYDPQTVPQKTSEIAKHFPALTSDQLQRVLDFCKHELIPKYNSLCTGLSGQWQLELYNHRGGSLIYKYDLHDGVMSISKDTSPNSATGWVTELPLTKLYNALEHGESLSSIYLRMRGIPFEEITEDPLICCIFDSKKIGAYQKNQLKLS